MTSTNVYPSDCVCLVTDTIDGVNYRASGVIIGPHTILTAAHVVWDATSGQSATNVEVSPGYNYNTNTTQIAGAAIHYNAVDDSGGEISESSSQTDFAIIDVTQNLSSYGAFQVDTNYTGNSASISGYPGSADQNDHPVQVTNSGSVTSDPYWSLLDYGSALGVSPGSSGGPIWIDNNGVAEVAGIVSTDQWGAELTAADWTQIQGWIAQDSSLWVTTVTGASVNSYTATFEGVLRQYTVGADGTTVTGGPEGANDSLVGVQRIQFVDGYEAYSTTDTAGEVYRLYEATLNRAPDPEGLTGWANALNNGTSLQSVANGFVSSAEFQADYGALDNSHFVTQLYNNVLHRAPDTVGLNYWVGELNSGAMNQAQVVVGFSQSPEDINDLAAPVQQGLWVGNPNAAEVARLYDTTLDRLPDLSGLTYWTNLLQTGTSLQTVVDGFVSSAEFQTNYGALDDTHFVSLLYENSLHRAPDSGGLSYWVSELDSGGMTRAQVVLGFSDSQEHVADTAPYIDGGIWLA